MNNKPVDVVAIVGAGKGGFALLKILSAMPDVRVKYICDINPNTPGMIYAKSKNFCCVKDYTVLSADTELNLIFEVTGRKEVYHHLKHICLPTIAIISDPGNKFVFSMLAGQEKMIEQLKFMKNNLQHLVLERTEEIETANRELELKILAYERLHEKLEQFNNEKTKYLLHATHQLKAPFAAIQSYTDIILGGFAGEISDPIRDISDKIKSRCSMLSNSIKHLLSLANLQSCIQENIVMEHVSVLKIMEPLVDFLSVLAKEKDITLTVLPFKENDTIWANEKQITMLFSVLIENAIKYSTANTSIEIVLKTLDQKLNVQIKDQGIGIAKEHIRKVFEQFFRTNEGTSINTEGSGLGLSIASEIAAIHNAKIDVESELGKGSTFSISFHENPVGQVSQKPVPAQTSFSTISA